MTPNKKSRQWVVRSSTTHRRDFLPSVVSAAFFCKTYNRHLTRNWGAFPSALYRHQISVTLTLNYNTLCNYSYVLNLYFDYSHAMITSYIM